MLKSLGSFHTLSGENDNLKYLALGLPSSQELHPAGSLRRPASFDRFCRLHQVETAVAEQLSRAQTVCQRARRGSTTARCSNWRIRLDSS